MKKYIKILLILTCLIALSACTTTDSATEEDTTVENTSVFNTAEMFTDRDLEIGYDEDTAVQITLSGDEADCDSDAVEISETTVTIKEEGTYIISGTLNDGMIIVQADDTDKIQLVLDGVNITSSTSAAIYVAEADKVFITTAAGSENYLSNGGEYIAIDDNNIDAVIFSKSDLTLNGAGTLDIQASAGHGIVSKDDLVLTSGSYKITAEKHGLSGKDSVRIANGNYEIVSGKDGIHAENTDDTDYGFLYIAGGTFDIDAQGDGISASACMQIDDGSFTIVTGEGSSSVELSANTTDFFQGQTSTSTSDSSVSQKGIKTDDTLMILNGDFVIDTVDDAIHVQSDLNIVDGNFELSSGDDAIHADAAVIIDNGTFTIDYCYEGIEGISVTINNGTIDINAVDDGINAAGGADQSGFGGIHSNNEQFTSSSDSYITINDGTITIVSSGDCLDSNGDITINGGTMTLTCYSQENTTIDCDGTYLNNGGSLTTNDGAENNSSFMNGKQGSGR